MKTLKHLDFLPNSTTSLPADERCQVGKGEAFIFLVSKRYRAVQRITNNKRIANKLKGSRKKINECIWGRHKKIDLSAD